MEAKIILEGGRLTFCRADGSIEIVPGKDRYTADEVAELMATLESRDETGPEQGD